MNPRRWFVRKMAYVVALAVILGLLNWLFRPASIGREGTAGDPGGIMAQIRQTYHLGESYLGQLDPASETIKLATLGLRGIAANILWTKATDYKIKKDWTNLSATLQQMTKIQPHFVGVWEFQAWNLSYNVSVEFDDYRQRYRWVLRGVDFLKEGIQHNQREAILQWDIGWVLSNKIGRADEKTQYRRMFKQDDDFHGSRPMAERDNWLVGRQWFLLAQDMVDHKGARIKSASGMNEKSPLLYRSEAPMCLMNYAEALEGDGVFGEVARRAWANASASWKEYGQSELLTTYGRVIRLGDKETFDATAARLAAELDSIAPGLRDKIKQERIDALSPKQREALDHPPDNPSQEQYKVILEAQERTAVRPADVARRVTGPQRARAAKIAADLEEAQAMSQIIDGYRQIVNFEYWRRRAEMEQSDQVLAAKMFIHQADQAYADGDPLAARKAYEQGLAAWRRVLDQYPFLQSDRNTGEDLIALLRRYKRALDQLDEPVPKDFPLREALEKYRQQGIGAQ